MKYSNYSILTGLLLSVGVSNAAITLGDSVILDFNTAGDESDFIGLRDNTPATGTLAIGRSATGGTGDSGHLQAVNLGTTNANNDIAGIYAPGGLGSGNGTIQFGVGQTVNLSMDFQILHQDEAATPRLSLLTLEDLNAITSNGTVTDYNGYVQTVGGSGNGATDGIGVNIATAGAKQFNIVNTFTNAARDFSNDGSTYALVNDSWYQFQVGITKSATVNELDVNATLNLLNADGTFNSVVATRSVTRVNAGFYSQTETGVLAGFLFAHDGEPDSVSNTYDNLSISVVPEPSSTALLGLGGLALILRRRK